MTIRIIQYNESCVTPNDDAELYKYIFSNESGVLEGCNITKGVGNEILISHGKLIVEGRIIVLENEKLVAKLSDEGNKKGRLLLRVDITKTLSNAAILDTQVYDELPELIQEKINADGQIYEFELATYDCSTTDISNIAETSIKIDNYNNKLYKKVDKIIGKQLTDENYTLQEKQKLSTVEENANYYSHPKTHSPSIITENEEKQFVTKEQKEIWNSKVDINHSHKAICDVITENTEYKPSKSGIYKVILTGAGQSGIMNKDGSFANAADTVIDYIKLDNERTYNITIGKSNKYCNGNSTSFDNILFASGGSAINSKSITNTDKGIVIKGEKGFKCIPNNNTSIYQYISGRSYWGRTYSQKYDDEVIKGPINQPLQDELIYFDKSIMKICTKNKDGTIRTLSNKLEKFKLEGYSTYYTVTDLIDVNIYENSMYSMFKGKSDDGLERTIFVITDLITKDNINIKIASNNLKYDGRYFYHPEYGGYLVYKGYSNTFCIEKYDILTNTTAISYTDSNTFYNGSSSYKAGNIYNHDKYITVIIDSSDKTVSTSIFDMSTNKYLPQLKTHAFYKISCPFVVKAENKLYNIVRAKYTSSEDYKTFIYVADLDKMSQYEMLLTSSETEKISVYKDKVFKDITLQSAMIKNSKIYIFWRDSYENYAHSKFTQYCSVVDINTKDIKVKRLGPLQAISTSNLEYGTHSIQSIIDDLIPIYGLNSGIGIDEYGLNTKYLTNSYRTTDIVAFGSGGIANYTSNLSINNGYDISNDINDYSNGGNGVCVIEYMGSDEQ